MNHSPADEAIEPPHCAFRRRSKLVPGSYFGLEHPRPHADHRGVLGAAVGRARAAGDVRAARVRPAAA